MLESRLMRGYSIILIGLVILVARRLLFPVEFDILPLAIVVPTMLTRCTNTGDLLSCGELVIAALTILLLIPALGWGSILGFMIVIALILPPAALFFLFTPIWGGLLLLLLPLLTYLLLDIWLPRVLEIA